MVKRKDNFDIDSPSDGLHQRTERIRRIKETVDIVFIRVILLCFLLTFAQQSISFLFGSYQEHKIAKKREQIEEQRRIAAEKLLIENQIAAKKKEVEEFNNYYNGQYQKYTNLVPPVDAAPTTDLVNGNSQEAINYRQRRVQESLQQSETNEAAIADINEQRQRKIDAYNEATIDFMQKIEQKNKDLEQALSVPMTFPDKEKKSTAHE
jgi:hypothetical protein